MATINIFYRTPTHRATKVASFNSPKCTLNDFCNHIIHEEGLNHYDFLLATGTKVIRRSSCSLKNTLLPADSHVDILIPTLGGKGGFGSLLRAIGAQIEKTTNRDACRDLSGRRLRDIKREDELKKLVALQEKLQDERKRRKQEKLEKLKKSSEAAQTGSSIQELVAMFEDQDYNKRRMELSDIIEAAVDKGIINFKKRQQEETEVTDQDRKKKICLEESVQEVYSDNCLAEPREVREDSDCDASLDTNDKKVKIQSSVVNTTKKSDLWLGLEEDEETC